MRMRFFVLMLIATALMTGCAGYMHYYESTTVVVRRPYVHRVERWYVPGGPAYHRGGGGFYWSSPSRGTVSGWEMGPNGKVRPVWRRRP
jgi:hypothetical protein